MKLNVSSLFYRTDGNNLRGQFPGKENGRLLTLETLDVHSNSLSGHIPIEVCNMKVLATLEMSNNTIGGNVPSCLGVLDLEKVYLQGNKLEGSIPSELGSLKNLTELLVADNMLTGNPIAVFDQMQSLQVLIASDNLFTGSLDTSFLDNVEQLFWVDISDNNFNSTSFPLHLLSRAFLNVLDVSR